MNKTASIISFIILSGLLPGLVAADPYVGHFVGESDGLDYRVSIDRFEASTYDGILRIDGERMQLDARRYGELMSGRLANETVQLGFRARVEGGILIMEIEDGRRIVFRRGAPD